MLQTYYMNIFYKGYHRGWGAARELELDYTATLPGDTETARLTLARLGMSDYQATAERELGCRISDEHVRIRFERETPATEPHEEIVVEGRIIMFCGNRCEAFPIPRRILHRS
jgi:hypothetical protein